MKRVILGCLSSFLFVQLCAAQASRPVIRVGDTFRGPVKQVRSERALLRVEEGLVVESQRTLFQVVNYSENGLSREILVLRGSSIQQKTVETYQPSGERESTSIFAANGTLISKIGYEYDSQGRLASEVRYNGDGSVKERKIIQLSDSPPRQLAVTKISGSGSTVETSINTIERDPHGGRAMRSVWSTTNSDGGRVENIFEVDKSGTHNDQQLFYSADGSLTGKRVSIVDAGVNRLEATEYDATGNIKNRTLETREYDSLRNLRKITNYKWNSSLQKFEPFVVSYHIIEYYQ